MCQCKFKSSKKNCCQCLPHSPQRPVIISNTVQDTTAFTLLVLHHKRAECKLKLRHVTRQLQLPALAERLRDRHMQYEGPDDEFHNGHDPCTACLTDVKFGKNLGSNEGELFDKVLHVDAGAAAHAGHGIDGLAEVDPV